ncbi:MAG TPA: prolipoprotein diacylglyceryl transferase family protein, partial [Burkholderiaceae bacterium]|nr:prolipoprotein diacylglyceryl transferase family protein [Burkholderiaceae bacterium]
YSRQPRPLGTVSAMFLIGYGVLRFIAEFGREPDAFIGLLAFDLSMGQWLSLPMVIIGIGLFIYCRRRPMAPVSQVRSVPPKETTS